MRAIEVVPHDPTWRRKFDIESKSVGAALGGDVIAIHHIGSTSIPGIFAKPVIDMLVEVAEIDEVDGRSREMEAIGYQVMGAFGIEGRRYFRKDDETRKRTYQIHVFETGSSQLKRHLDFRDFMIAHPEIATQYSELKRRLAEIHPDSPEDYMDGKDAFIKEIDERAAIWSATLKQPA